MFTFFQSLILEPGFCDSGEVWETKTFLQTRSRRRTWEGLSQEGPVGSCSVTYPSPNLGQPKMSPDIDRSPLGDTPIPTRKTTCLGKSQKKNLSIALSPIPCLQEKNIMDLIFIYSSLLFPKTTAVIHSLTKLFLLLFYLCILDVLPTPR